MHHSTSKSRFFISSNQTIFDVGAEHSTEKFESRSTSKTIAAFTTLGAMRVSGAAFDTFTSNVEELIGGAALVIDWNFSGGACQALLASCIASVTSCWALDALFSCILRISFDTSQASCGIGAGLARGNAFEALLW